MKKTLALLFAALPLAAFAAPQGYGGGAPPGDEAARTEHMQKRMRLARDLGLAEALDLSEADALKLSSNLAKIDARRVPLVRQLRDSMQVVRRAAEGDAAALKDLDQAVQRYFDVRTQMQALDRETYQTVTQGLSPEKRARAAVFLARFQHRMMRMGGMGPGGGHGMGHEGPGMRPGMMGPGGMGGMREGPGPAWGMNDGPDDPMDCEDCPMH